MNPGSRIRQGGTTLITALVMLVVLTLMALSAMRASTTNIQIAGNTQMEGETIAAAQQGIDQVLSNNFTANPVPVNLSVDINDDGKSDYPVVVTPTSCMGSVILPMNTPSLPKQCYKDGVYNASDTSPSYCAAQQWELTSQATDPSTSSTQTIHQGVSLIVSVDTACN